MSVMHFANALVLEIIGPAMAGPTGPCATPMSYMYTLQLSITSLTCIHCSCQSPVLHVSKQAH